MELAKPDKLVKSGNAEIGFAVAKSLAVPVVRDEIGSNFVLPFVQFLVVFPVEFELPAEFWPESCRDMTLLL